MAGPGPDKDVHISLEDQQKINKFARQNQRLEDIKDELKLKEAEQFIYRLSLQTRLG